MKTCATYDLDRLRTELTPFKLHWFPAIGSTNTHAAKMRREGRLLAPAVLLTGRQTAGGGAGSNVWHAPRGVMTATFVLSIHETLPPQHVPLVAGLAVCDAVAEFGAADVGLKWPNDLWHSDRKLAGLLCERVDRLDLIGVGLNANLDTAALPRAVAPTTCSLDGLLGRRVDQTALVAAIARHLRTRLADPAHQPRRRPRRVAGLRRPARPARAGDARGRPADRRSRRGDRRSRPAARAGAATR